MLKEIQSSVFRKKSIIFHKGLNIILGDNQGSNSIGKSTLLMIIDFIFGGSSYIEKNKDTVRNLGDHFFNFILEFDGEKYYFRRSTQSPNIVNLCDEDFNSLDSWKLDKYRSFLRSKYIGEDDLIKFRSCVGIFSRIAQKENFFNSKPLKAVMNSKEADGINLLMKLFNTYSAIESIEKEIKNLEKRNLAINNANKHKYIKKPTAKQYESNKKYIEKNSIKLNKIAVDFSNDFNSFLNVNYQEIHSQLHEIRKQKEIIENKLNRVNSNIESVFQVKKESFKPLQEYFEDVNIEKLQEIEKFHKGINDILLEEFYKAKDAFTKNITELDNSISILEGEILDDNVMESIPEKLLQPLVETINELTQKKKENSIYEEYNFNKETKESKKEDLVTTKQNILHNIEIKINSEMKKLNNYIYGETNKCPIFTIKENEYYLSLPDNTGTGRGCANLVIFDMCILKTTMLPIIIHDSVMFKNIGNAPMTKIIELYNNEKKQCFIAMDEVNKFSVECQAILYDKHVISLSEEEILFTKDWRKE